MKNATYLALILFLSFPIETAQKLDSILSRSSFSYGLSHHYHSYNPIPSGTYTEITGRAEAFGFEYLYRPAGKNEIGFGSSKQVNSEDYSFLVQPPTAVVFFEDYRIKKTKNSHFLVLKRHFIEDKLIGSVGLYYLRHREPYLSIN